MKIPRCSATIFRPRDANLQCMKPAGHEKRGDPDHQFPATCPSCGNQVAPSGHQGEGNASNAARD